MAGFDESVRWFEESGVWRSQLTSDWLQGRAAFGGLLAGAAVQAMESLVEDGRFLRSALVNFVGPAAPGIVQTQPRILRVGGSLTQATAEVTQGETVATTVSAVFGAFRPTNLPIEAPRAPKTPAPETLQTLPFLPGITPGFTQHFEYRWAGGGMPFSGAPEPYLKGWIRPHGGGGLTSGMLMGLLDAWPSPLLTISPHPIAGSSSTWHVNVYQSLEGKPFEWCLYESKVNWSRGGFTDFEAHIWDEGGELIASSRQLFIDFSAR